MRELVGKPLDLNVLNSLVCKTRASLSRQQNLSYLLLIFPKLGVLHELLEDEIFCFLVGRVLSKLEFEMIFVALAAFRQVSLYVIVDRWFVVDIDSHLDTVVSDMLNAVNNAIESHLFIDLLFETWDLGFTFLFSLLLLLLWLGTSELKDHGGVLGDNHSFGGFHPDASCDIPLLHELEHPIKELLFVEARDDGFLLHELFEELNVFVCILKGFRDDEFVQMKLDVVLLMVNWVVRGHSIHGIDFFLLRDIDSVPVRSLEVELQFSDF